MRFRRKAAIKGQKGGDKGQKLFFENFFNEVRFRRKELIQKTELWKQRKNVYFGNEQNRESQAV